MTRFIRPLALPALLAVALATGAQAQADSVTVVTFGPDGFSLTSPGDAPVGDEPAALLRVIGSKGWAMKTLSQGDIPSDEAMAFPHYVHTSREIRLEHSEGRAEARGRLDSRMARIRADREPLRLRTPRLGEEIVEVIEMEAQHSVLFEITAALGPLEMDDALVTQLSQDDALRRLEVSDDVNSGTLEARFMFDSLEDWEAWKAAPETTQMLDALRAATEQMRTRMEVRQ